ncbi:MAG: RNA polymerase sigma factor [Desulfomonilaceae bacterium]
MQAHDTSTDEELAQRAQGGSARDFAVLVDRYTPAVYRLARGITGSLQDAEDVVQETFLRAFRYIDDFSPARAPFKTWLLTIARNQSINIFCSLKRRTLRFLNEDVIAERGGGALDCLLSGNERDCESLLALKQECSLVESALKLLPERQRTAVLLKAQEDLSYEEIALVMKTSVSSVESLIFRGRKRLLGILKD